MKKEDIIKILLKIIDFIKDYGYNYIIKSRFDVHVHLDSFPSFPIGNTIHNVSNASNDIVFVANIDVFKIVYDGVIDTFLNKIKYIYLNALN